MVGDRNPVADHYADALFTAARSIHDQARDVDLVAERLGCACITTRQQYDAAWVTEIEQRPDTSDLVRRYRFRNNRRFTATGPEIDHTIADRITCPAERTAEQTPVHSLAAPCIDGENERGLLMIGGTAKDIDE